MKEQLCYFCCPFATTHVNKMLSLPFEIKQPRPIGLLFKPPRRLLTICLPVLLRLGNTPWQASLISASLERCHESVHWQLMTALLEKEDIADQQVFPHQEAQREWTVARAHCSCLTINSVSFFWRHQFVLYTEDSAVEPRVLIAGRTSFSQKLSMSSFLFFISRPWRF